MSHDGREMFGCSPSRHKSAQLPHHGLVTERYAVVKWGAEDLGLPNTRHLRKLVPPEAAIGFAKIVQKGEYAQSLDVLIGQGASGEALDPASIGGLRQHGVQGSRDVFTVMLGPSVIFNQRFLSIKLRQNIRCERYF
nr:hypothetical protein [Methylobacterium terrae]